MDRQERFMILSVIATILIFPIYMILAMAYIIASEIAGEK